MVNILRKISWDSSLTIFLWKIIKIGKSRLKGSFIFEALDAYHHLALEQFSNFLVLGSLYTQNPLWFLTGFCLCGLFLFILTIWEIMCCAKLLQSCPILFDPMDYSLPRYSVHLILQARKKVKVKVKSLSPVWPFLTPCICSPPGSSIHGIFQAGILEWVAISFSRGSSWPRDWTQISHIVGRHLHSKPPGKFQARILEWIAVPFSRGSWNYSIKKNLNVFIFVSK